MSRKDYEAIAKILAEEAEANRNSDEGWRAVSAITWSLAEYFAEDNPEFNRSRFMAAAGINQ